MKKLTSLEIRKIWLDYFISKDHYVIPSSSLIPYDDDSLLWINSGIATLKKYFEQIEEPPAKKLVNIQKAIRTGDIDNVGVTTRHHTFFEMLGNFSIGDYFKKEAIYFAWDILTNEKYYGIPKELLYVTIFNEDKEAYLFWSDLGVAEDRIFKMDKKSNFWDMGKGPSGPSTEIFFDKGEKYDPRAASECLAKDLENDRYVEIWNIVFSQFNNDGAGNYTELPQKNIDTGAGLERIAACLQDKPTNFETDLFADIIIQIQKLSSCNYQWDYIPSKLKQTNIKQFEINVSFKKIADFSRTLTMALADGALPGPNGRGYVLRKLLRQAVLNAHKLNIQENFLYLLPPIIAKGFENVYPNVNENLNKIVDIIKHEEEVFKITLKDSIKQFDIFISETGTLTEKQAFTLFETYGLPLEMVYELAEVQKIKLNKAKIDQLFSEFKAKTKINSKKTIAMNEQNELFSNVKPTNFVGYQELEAKAKVIAKEGYYFAFDKTPFYATSGGQEFDHGKVGSSNILSVVKNGNGVFIHELDNNKLKIGDEAELIVEKKYRSDSAKNHSATHLIFAALEKILHQDLPQAGSKVTNKFWRFDFLYQETITAEQLVEAEALANRWVNNATDSVIKEMPMEEAKRSGAKFLAENKYKNIVRVVKLNDEVIDLCGGTHVKNTKDIEIIKLTLFEKKGVGTFRIEGTSGKENVEAKIKEMNCAYAKKASEKLVARMIDLNKKDEKFNILNFDEVNKLIAEINNLNYSDVNWKAEFNALIKKESYELDKVSQVMNNHILKLVEKELNNNKNTSLLILTNFRAMDIAKMGLRLINNFANKILIIKTLDEEKMSIAFVLSPDLINSQFEKKINKIVSTVGLRGNGKKQLFIFGGKIALNDKVDQELKKWEF